MNMINNTPPLPTAGNRPFKTPEGFLASLPEEIIRRTESPSSETAAKRMPKIIRILIPAAAAAVVTIILGSIPTGGSSAPLSSEQAFAALSTEDQTDLIDYYTDNIIYDETY